MGRRCGLGPLALGAALLAAPSAARAGDEGWSALGGGVEHRRLASGSIAGHAFRFEPAEVELRLVAAPGGRAPVASFAPEGEAIATNASFFDEDGRTLGLAIDRGRSLGGRRLNRWAGFVLERGTARIVPGAALGDGARAELVVQGLPRLVVASAVPRLKPQRARRTALCLAGPHVVLVVATAAVDAIELARFLAAAPGAGGLGCREALNLDGGSSTQLVARWGGFSARVEGAAGVPNALVVTPRPAAPGP